MLNKPVDEIVMEGGHVVGVKSEGEVHHANFKVSESKVEVFKCCRSSALTDSAPCCRWLAASSSSATPATFQTACAKQVR